ERTEHRRDLSVEALEARRPQRTSNWLRPTAALGLRRRRTLMENHPVDAEPIAHLAKAGGKELLSNRHQDLTAVGKGGENAVSVTVTIHSQRQVGAPHRLGLWNVRRPEFSVANRNARVQHCVLPLGADAAL